jgi:hypothetical protein
MCMTQNLIVFTGWITFSSHKVYSCVFIASQDSKSDVFRLKQIEPKYTFPIVL